MNAPGADFVAMLGAALVAGLAGSLHCLGMCGGIAGALGMRATGSNGLRSAAAVAAHHLGRLASYALAGAAAGGAGAGLGALIDPGRVGPWLRIAAGAFIILIGLRIAFRWNLMAGLERLGGRLWARLAPAAGRLARGDGLTASFGLGALWGFLPCGLVYSMLLLAAMSGSAVAGALVMAAFGVGTLPSMATSSFLSSRATHWFSTPFSRGAAAVLLIAFGVATAAMPLKHLATSGHAGQDHGMVQHDGHHT